MTADRLREAASLLRERAEAATPGRWRTWNDGHVGAPGTHIGGIFMPTAGSNWDRQMPDAEYAATMSPPVALALADWLEHTAFSFDWKISFAREKAEEYAFSPKDAAEWQALADQPEPTRDERDALAVADAILGTTDTPGGRRVSTSPSGASRSAS